MNKKIVSIIGAGDVVKKRIKPSLESLGFEVNLYSNEITEGVFFIDEEDKWIENIKDSEFVWIATPSYVHIYYIKKLIDVCKFLVVEKPITCYKEEIKELQKILETKRNKIFFTSYYLLEKALPLYYLKNPNKIYREYLNFYMNEHQLLHTEINTNNILEKLGDLKSVELHLIEGKDERSWPFLNKYGTQMLETFLHLLLVSAPFTWNIKYWSDLKYVVGDFIDVEGEKSPGIIKLEAKSGQIDVDLLMAKNQSDDYLSRGGILTFEDGRIFVDFDNMEITIKLYKLDRTFKFSVKEEFKNKKYLLQCNLILNCLEDNSLIEKIDGLENQLEIIEWILNFLKGKKPDVIIHNIFDIFEK